MAIARPLDAVGVVLVVRGRDSVPLTDVLAGGGGIRGGRGGGGKRLLFTVHTLDGV